MLEEEFGKAAMKKTQVYEWNRLFAMAVRVSVAIYAAVRLMLRVSIQKGRLWTKKCASKSFIA
jgi:hypothetical protein